MESSWNFHTFLVGIWNATTTLEISLVVSLKSSTCVYSRIQKFHNSAPRYLQFWVTESWDSLPFYHSINILLALGVVKDHQGTGWDNNQLKFFFLRYNSVEKQINGLQSHYRLKKQTKAYALSDAGEIQEENKIVLLRACSVSTQRMRWL